MEEELEKKLHIYLSVWLSPSLIPPLINLVYFYLVETNESLKAFVIEKSSHHYMQSRGTEFYVASIQTPRFKSSISSNSSSSPKNQLECHFGFSIHPILKIYYEDKLYFVECFESFPHLFRHLKCIFKTMSKLSKDRRYYRMFFNGVNGCGYLFTL